MLFYLFHVKWWQWITLLFVVGIWTWALWKLTPFMVAIGALTFCLIYPGCHFQ